MYRAEGDGVLNRVDQGTERAAFFRHPQFPAMGLLTARFRRHRYDLHTHPTYVIALITAGCEAVRVGGRREMLPAGQVLVVHPEESHDGEAGCAAGWAYRTFYPPVELMRAVAGELGQAGLPQFGHGAIDDPVLVPMLAAAHRLAELGDRDEAEGALLVALRRLILVHGDGGRPGRARLHGGAGRRMAVYRDMIEGDPGGRFDLAGFAAAVGVTRFQVIRDFRVATGLTPGGFVRDRRVRVARRLIEGGETLAGAAAAAGFADQSHLSRAFRLAQGFTPGALRESVRGGR